MVKKISFFVIVAFVVVVLFLGVYRMGLFGKKEDMIDLGFLTDLEIMALVNTLEMYSDEITDKNTKSTIAKAIKNVNKGSVTKEEMACIKEGLNRFIKWFEKTSPGVQINPIINSRSALSKIRNKGY